MKKILITGGAGFIGSHLAEGLAKLGYQVVIFDNLRTGKLENLYNIPHQFIKGDIRDYPTLYKTARGCEVIYHLAALTSVVESVKKMDECISINLHGTINVLKAAHENKVRKFIFASSAAVYGETPELPKTEAMRPEPKSPYAITKMDGEYYCHLFHESFGIPTVCARFFNVFGERQDPFSPYASAIPIFISKALKKEPITIFGDGTQTRDFIYVKDIVKSLILLKDYGFGVYNLGYGKTIDINNLVVMIRKIINTNVPIQYRSDRIGEIKHSYASAAKIEGLGFKPDYSIEEGLERVYSNMKKSSETWNIS